MDASFNDLSANTTYDLSVCLFNLGDVSNNRIAATGTTRPSDFSGNDVSQNLVDTSANTIVLKIKLVQNLRLLFMRVLYILALLKKIVYQSWRVSQA